MKLKIENDIFYSFCILRELGDFTLLCSHKYENCFLLVGKNKNEFVCEALNGNKTKILTFFNEIATTNTPIYAITDLVADFRVRNK